MKVLLVRPGAPNTLSFTNILDSEPLELEYLHTGLKEAGYEDMIYDYICQNKPFRAVLKEYEPDVVAITGYITQENMMKKFCMQAKKYKSDIATIVGGVHAQINTEVFYTECIDYIARSESVDAFVEIVTYIGLKKGLVSQKDIVNKSLIKKLGDINGLCYKLGGEWKNNAMVPIDINSLPIPDRSFFYENKQHFRYLDLLEAANIKTSFSCPYNCKFCYCTLLNHGRYRERDLNLVIEELKGISVQNITISDDDFLVNEKRLRDFIRLVKENNIKKTYVCYGRADFIASHPELIKELADIGFKYFLVGLEAISDEELNDYNKGTSKEHNARAVEVINATSAQCIGLMIVGLSATKKDFDDLYNWIVKHELIHVTISIFTPIPGTPLFEEYRDRLITNKIEYWDFLHLVVEPENISRRKFYMYYRSLILKLYKRARKAGMYEYLNLGYYKKMLSRFLLRKAYLDW